MAIKVICDIIVVEYTGNWLDMYVDSVKERACRHVPWMGEVLN